jgi:hypothetical protein
VAAAALVVLCERLRPQSIANVAVKFHERVDDFTVVVHWPRLSLQAVQGHDVGRGFVRR